MSLPTLPCLADISKLADIPSITLAHPQHIPCHQPDTLCVSVLKPHKKR